MIRLRLISAMLLSLLVAVTSQEMALLRGQTKAVGVAVLCIDDQAISVSVDADGKPIKPSHFCPDCALNVMVAVADAPTQVQAVVGRSRSLLPVTVSVSVGKAVPVPTARGPPVAV